MKKLAIIVMIIFIFLLGACTTVVADAEQTYPLKIWKQNTNGCYKTLLVVDDDTGVNYIVVSGDMYSDPIGACITPRLNADGSLYVTP